MNDDEALNCRIESRVEAVVLQIDVAICRGDGSGLAALRRRAESWMDPKPAPRSVVERVQASIDFEASSWVEAMIEVLLPEVRAAVAATILEDAAHNDHGLHGPDPWVMVDDQARLASERRRTSEILRAERAATACCQAYQRTHRTRCLRDAVSHLESAVEAMRRPVCPGVSMEACAEHADRLERALRKELPPSEFRYFVTGVRDEIDDRLTRVGRPRLNSASEADHWLSREEWTSIGPSQDREVGVWFVDWCQEGYNTQMQQDQLAEEAEQRRKSDADEKVRQWQATRDEEASVRTEEISAEPDPPAVTPEPESFDHEDEPPTPFAQTQVPDLGDSDHVAWPAHVQDAAQYLEAKAQKQIAEDQEFRQAREQQALKEAERLEVEAIIQNQAQAFRTWQMRKADARWNL